MVGDRPYKPAPLSPRQKAASFEMHSDSGGSVFGAFVDGYEHSSYVVRGRAEDVNLVIFLRHDTDFPRAARMLRAAADKLEEVRF